MKILVAVDGSSFSKRMLAYLAAHDDWLGSHHQYTVLHVLLPMPPRAAAVLGKVTVKDYQDGLSEKVLRPIRVFFARHELSTQYLVQAGPAGETIAAAAEKGRFDLVMLGSHGHGSLTNLVMGSVATKVLAACSTPALLIR
ncbi:MAG: universal stress protein [Rubrivivax sp.]|nr:universal stress protein [Rubrivivax sp.]